MVWTKFDTLFIAFVFGTVAWADQLNKAKVGSGWRSIPEKIANGKEARRTKLSDAAIQADLHTTPHTHTHTHTQIISSEEEEIEQAEDETSHEELEVNAALKEIKLPQPDALSVISPMSLQSNMRSTGTSLSSHSLSHFTVILWNLGEMIFKYLGTSDTLFHAVVLTCNPFISTYDLVTKILRSKSWFYLSSVQCHYSVPWEVRH